MLWFSVWTVLVLATLGGAFLLGRSLWRSAVALGRELSRAADVTAQLAERVDELQAAAGRRADREQRHVATRLRWQAYWR